MTTAYVCLAAGQARRMFGIPKWGLWIPADGKTLRERLEGQFPGVRYLTHATHPHSRCASETFLLSEPLWADRTVILLGDVWYSDLTAARIKNSTRDLVFFSDKQDIFAIKFDWAIGENRLLPAASEATQYFMHNDGRLWETYRRLLGIPPKDTLPPPSLPCLELISDDTQDFDTWEEYTAWLKGERKNRLLAET